MGEPTGSAWHPESWKLQSQEAPYGDDQTKPNQCGHNRQ
jgi:hypothetical protein